MNDAIQSLAASAKTFTEQGVPIYIKIEPLSLFLIFLVFFLLLITFFAGKHFTK